jgi:iron(III) transport system permease protein
MPLARPAFIAGLMLVIMETLSDFGAVDHFAVQTFTTGIFRTWYGLYDLNTAMQLSSLLLMIIFLFYFLERFSREGVNYTNDNSTFKTSKEINLKGVKSGLVSFFCFLPIFIGFILPIIELIIWALDARVTLFNEKFIMSSFNTITLGILTGVLCAFLALTINFSIRYTKNNFLGKLSSFLSIGYAIPGLILAVGITRFLVFADRNIFSDLDFVITGSLVGLVLAYIIKSYALANSSIESGYKRISNSIDNSARLLGARGSILLGKVHFPLMKTSFLTAILLVTSEVVKELPATLILRPFNFDTLAVVTYTYAAEERMYQAAMPSLAIVLIGIVPLIFLSKMIRSSRLAGT